jgi:nucleotide-binding universal stress UspA family protein
MENSANKILVPTDFSKVADCAVDHAIKLASELSNGHIILLHVVGKDSDHHEAKLKLEGLGKSIQEKYNVKAEYIIRTGNIFDDIGAVANEIEAKLIIMGTHGAKGFQKITGSYALKVITNSEVPFVVVQQRPIGANGYKKIIFPLDFTKESKHKLKQTVELAKFFKSEIIIVSPTSNDEFIRRSINNNLNFTENILSENGISFRAEEIDDISPKKIIAFAVQENADLIAIVNEQKAALMSLADEQDIIANEPQIPVLCVNPAQVTVAGGLIGS